MGLEADPLGLLWISGVARYQLYSKLEEQSLNRTVVASPQYRAVRYPHHEGSYRGNDALRRSSESACIGFRIQLITSLWTLLLLRGRAECLPRGVYCLHLRLETPTT